MQVRVIIAAVTHRLNDIRPSLKWEAQSSSAEEGPTDMPESKRYIDYRVSAYRYCVSLWGGLLNN